ncbi:Uncharacterised protein [Streptococcus pneumoniae]|nr:Uncharacterised protein [Streptococcus pneumoniae]
MRHKFQQVLNKIHDFLNGYDQPDQTETNSLTATIEEAIQKQTAVHLILSHIGLPSFISILYKIFLKCEPDYPCLRQALQVTSSNMISKASKLS